MIDEVSDVFQNTAAWHYNVGEEQIKGSWLYLAGMPLAGGFQCARVRTVPFKTRTTDSEKMASALHPQGVSMQEHIAKHKVGCAARKTTGKQAASILLAVQDQKLLNTLQFDSINYSGMLVACFHIHA